MPRKPRLTGDNFRLLDPDAARTRNIVAAIEDARDPLPWDGTAPPRAQPPLAQLAARIHDRAAAGKTVHLTPATAFKVADALARAADGPIGTAALQKTYGFRVVSYGPDDAGEVLAWCRNLDIGKGAYDGALRTMPGARLALRWGGFAPRRNFT